MICKKTTKANPEKKKDKTLLPTHTHTHTTIQGLSQMS